MKYPGCFFKFVLTFLFFSYIIIIGGEYMITTISLPEVFMAKIREEAKKSGMSISEYIRYCVTRYWDEKRGD